MKSKYNSLIKFVKTSSKLSKLIAAGVFLALFVTTSAFALNNFLQKPDTSSNVEEVKSSQNPVLADKSEEKDTAKIQSQATTNSSPSPEYTVDNPTNTTSAPKPVYDNSTALPRAQVVPFYQFSISISPWGMTNISPNEVRVPFVIVHKSGQATPISYSSAQILPATPGMTCTPIINNPESGELRVYVPDTAPNGQYTCKLSVKIGASTQSDQFTFTVSDNPEISP